MEHYEVLARYYDLENADFTADLPFWIDLAKGGPGPVLELGCGTGRVLLQLAREGHAVVGVDNSEAMLTRLRGKLDLRPDLRGRVEFIHQDFTALSLGRQFGLVLMPFNTFAHLLSRAEQKAMLDRVREHLLPGGRFALDLPNSSRVFASAQEGLVLERIFHDEQRHRRIEQFSSFRLDRAAQLGHITWLYDEIDEEGRLYRTTLPMTLRYFFPEELRALLELHGLRVTSIFGDYEQGPLEEDSPRLLVIAEKMGD